MTVGNHGDGNHGDTDLSKHGFSGTRRSIHEYITIYTSIGSGVDGRTS